MRNSESGSIGDRTRSSTDDERNARRDACDAARPSTAGARPALRRRLDERIDDAAESDGGERRAPEIEPRRRAAPPRLSGTWRQTISSTISGHRHVDQEGPGPRIVIDQEAAEHRPDRGRDAAEPRPGADGPAALLLGKRSADERQAAGHQQGAADALHARAPGSVAARRRPARRPTEASANSATPIAKILRRPKWSPSEPPTSSSAARNSA